MVPVALVRANALIPFITFLEGIGAPVDHLLLDVGLSPAAAGQGEQLMPLTACLSFLARAAELERLPELGLLVGGQTRFEQLGAFARLIRRGATVLDALRDLIAGVTLHNSGDRLWLSQIGGTAALSHRFAVPATAPGSIHGELFTATMMIGALRTAIGARWAPEAVQLPMAAASLHKRCEELLRAPVRCAGDITAVEFAASLLGAPNRARRFPVDDADWVQLVDTAPAADFPGSIRQLVAALLAEGYPDIRRTAKAAGLSVRTLQRHLADAGETYSNLVDAARYEASVRLLRDGRAKMIDIAGDLGYADAASFSRAFRRWAGMPPRGFRGTAG